LRTSLPRRRPEAPGANRGGSVAVKRRRRERSHPAPS
jgi:hypothetical protein